MTDKLLGVEDNAATTLTAPINAVVTTIPVASAAAFSGVELPFALTIADEAETQLEIVLVSAVNVGANTLTVTRAHKSGPFSYSTGSTVTLRVISQHIADLNEQAIWKVTGKHYAESTANGSGQVTLVEVYETAAKLRLLTSTTFTYPDALSQLPDTADRKIFLHDGVTIRRREQSTFTYDQLGKMTTHTRVIV